MSKKSPIEKAVAKLMPSQQIAEMEVALHNARYFLMLAGHLWDKIELITEYLTPEEAEKLKAAGKIYGDIQRLINWEE